MEREQVTPVDEFPAPYGKRITLQQITYENGFSMLRMRIREGRRFTTLDLDTDTARHWAGEMLAWADAQTAEK